MIAKLIILCTFPLPFLDSSSLGISLRLLFPRMQVHHCFPIITEFHFSKRKCLQIEQNLALTRAKPATADQHELDHFYQNRADETLHRNY
jgi:hypothetical protein